MSRPHNAICLALSTGCHVIVVTRNSATAQKTGRQLSAFVSSLCHFAWAFGFFGRTSVLRMMFFSEHQISEMRGPTGVKFCTMVSTRPNFIMPSKILKGAPQKNFGGEKHAKFGPISDDFEVRRRISPKRIKIFKFGFLFRLPRFLLR